MSPETAQEQFAEPRSDEVVGASWELPRRKIIDCPEWGELSIDPSDLYVGGRLQLYDDIAASKYLRVKIAGQAVVFSSTHYVGHIPLNDQIALNVVPRFGISNLTRVLRIARHAPLVLERYVRRYVATHESLPSIFDDLAAAFVSSVEEVVRQGLLQKYDRLEQNTSLPRGRVLAGPTVNRHLARGMKARVVASWFERSPDNSINRLLKYAIWLVDRRLSATTPRRGTAQLRTRLNRFYRLFAKVPLDLRRTFLQDLVGLDVAKLPAVRSYYAQAIELALLLVQDRAPDLSKHEGTIRAPSMLFDLQTGFEAYLRNVLEAAQDDFGGRRVFDGNQSSPSGAKKRLFDHPESEDATPDAVIATSTHATREGGLVIEVKYKDSPDRSDVNQAIAYAASFRTTTVVLAYVKAEGHPGGLSVRGRIGKFTLYGYAFDLAGDLPASEKEFVTAMAGLSSESWNAHT